MTGLFISYRRADSAGYAGRLAETLEAHFGTGSVFRDVEDIRPGEDFVAAIEGALARVDALLVLIGPDWLEADAHGRRRLDDPEDFVHREVAAALHSGKPVIPVLVGGATMPKEEELPVPLEPLARRQAFSLTEAGWRDDVARLVASLEGPSGKASRRSLAWGLAALGIASLLVFVWWAMRPSGEALRPEQLAGRWSALVRYDWGAQHREAFEFRVEAGVLTGIASYLRLARPIEQGRLEDGRLSFITRSQEVLGDAPAREVTHHYRGVMAADGIRFTLQSGGGYSQHPPVVFTARREGG